MWILQKVGKELLEFTGDDVDDFEGREDLEILLEEEENEKKGLLVNFRVKLSSNITHTDGGRGLLSESATGDTIPGK